MGFFDPAAETDKIVEFLREFSGNRNVIIGVSGGIDSSVVMKLASIAFPRDRIYAFFLPETRTYEADSKDVGELSKSTGIAYRTLLIDPIVDSYIKVLNSDDKFALANLKARIRMTLLYYFSNIHNGIVLGTTNRSEYLTGYFTKFGDGACDVEPIMHLYKTQVREIAAYLGIPDNIISKPPSAGLWTGQTDEEELGISYSSLDAVLQKMDSGQPVDSPAEFQVVTELISRSEHKRNPPASMEFDRK